MKKRFGFYAISWSVLLVLFNVIAFIAPGWTGIEKYGASFWIGYVFISVTFLGQLACAWFALKEENMTKLFYKVSLITMSYIGLIITFVVGGLCMLISSLPYWIGIIVCSIVLVANILSLMKATAVIEEVQKIDEKVKLQTAFIKALTLEAESLLAKAQSEAVKTECKKVYEAIRYSDPMSNSALATIENEITQKFTELCDTVAKDNLSGTSTLTCDILALIDNRNKKCRLLK